MKTSPTGTVWFGITVVAAMAIWSTQGVYFYSWFEFILGRPASLVEMVAIGGLGIVAATTAFAAGARYFKASIKPTNSIVAGVVVSFAAYFLMLPLHLIFYSARHAGWTTLGTVVTVSFFAPLLFGDDKQSEK